MVMVKWSKGEELEDFTTRETISTQSIRPIELLSSDSIQALGIPGVEIAGKHIRPSMANRQDGIARLNALLAHTSLKLMVSVNGVRFAVKALYPGRTSDTVHCELSECEASIEIKSSLPMMLYVDYPQSFRGTLT